VSVGWNPASVSRLSSTLCVTWMLKAVRERATPIDAPCTQRLRHGDPMHAQKQLTLEQLPLPLRRLRRVLRAQDVGRPGGLALLERDNELWRQTAVSLKRRGWYMAGTARH
jgi:hypothetical protein